MSHLVTALLMTLQEGANVTHIVGKLDRVLQRYAEQRQAMQDAPAQQPQYLGERLKQMRASSLVEGTAIENSTQL